MYELTQDDEGLYRRIIKVDAKRNFVVFGMRKSGHHAITNWITNFHIPAIHFNDCITVNNKIYSTVERLYVDNGFDNSIASFSRHERRGSKQDEDNYNSIFKFVKDNKLETNIVTFESKEFLTNKDVISNNIDNITFVVVLRDVFNQYSEPRHPINHIWKEHAKLCLGNINTDVDIIDVSFNSWFSDINYREKLAERLGIEFDSCIDSYSINEVPRPGASRFDSSNFNGNAQKMGVLSRYELYNNIEEKIDNEMVMLTKEYFNFVPDRFKSMLGG